MTSLSGSFEGGSAAIAGAAFALIIFMLLQQIAVDGRRRRERLSREVDQMAALVRSQQAASKADVIARVIERLPTADLSRQQLEDLMDTAVPASSEPPKAPEKPTAPAVEALITNYHEQALGQAKAQFWFSIAGATVGFVWILWAGSTIDPGNATTAAGILPGVVMEAAAFLYFRQASETRQRATELYDRLRRDKQLAESAQLVASIEDVRLRSAVQAQLALHMSGLQPAAIDLSTFLSSGVATPPEKDGGE